MLFAGIHYGHTGHVRFLTIVENPVLHKPATKPTQSLKTKALSRRSQNAEKLQKQAETTQNNKETLVISGGDGYEDFRSSSMTEDAGREDSTNHLLLWRVWTNFTAYRVTGYRNVTFRFYFKGILYWKWIWGGIQNDTEFIMYFLIMDVKIFDEYKTVDHLY